MVRVLCFAVTRTILCGVLVTSIMAGHDAWAAPHGGDHRPGGVITTMEMPTVVGRTRRQAVRALEDMGLTVEVTTRIGARPGSVMEQDPTPGTQVEIGATVAIQVAIRPFVQTIVPDVRGMEEAEALEALRDVYVVEVVQTNGPREAAGNVLRQVPRPGTKHPYRGDIRLQVCLPPTIVPRLIGRRVRDARDVAEAYGLVVKVDHVAVNAHARPGTVTAQNPRSGAEVLSGATISLQVAGKHASPVGTLLMPDLNGLSFDEAQQLLWSCGLSPRWNDRAARGEPFCVVAQSISPGAAVSPASNVTVTLCRPAGNTTRTTVAAPDVRGLSQDDAMSLLRLFGARVMPRWMPSPLPAGTVLAQFPEPGTPMRVGGLVIVGLARSVGRGTRRLAVRAPTCEGMTIGAARARALRAGLQPRIVQRDHPRVPLNQVVEQHPAAGARMRVGRALTLVIPARVQLPDFVNKPWREARAFCEQQGLQLSLGNAQDMRRRGGRLVVQQEPRPGTIVPKGSTVSFRLVRRGRGGHVDPNPSGNRVRVPELIGRSVRDARALLQARGLQAALTGPRMHPSASAVVTAQDRPKGSLVHRGATIRIAYRLSTTGGTQPAQTVVPDVGGRSAARARELLQGAGFRVTEKGIRIQLGKFRTRVIKQVPPAGTRVAPGSEVTIHLGF